MTPAQSLVLSACQERRDDTARATFAALVATVDWTEATTLALHHGVVGALLEALDGLDALVVPPDLLEAMRTFLESARQRNDRLARELAAILESVDRHDIQAIPFKGPLLSERLYRDRPQRPTVDLDIFLRPADVTGFLALLRARGYRDAFERDRPGKTAAQHRIYRRYQCQYLFERHDDGMFVEPHWALAQYAMAIDLDYEAMFTRARRRPFGDRSAWSFADEDLVLVLCVHGAKHAWRRLADIRDLATLLDQGELDLQQTVDGARTQRCARILLLGLGAAIRFGGASVPGDLRRHVDNDPEVTALLKRIEDRLFDTTTAEAHYTSLDAFRYRLRERWSDRVRYVVRTLLVPNHDHVNLIALPAPLWWLYYPVRWGHDYFALPLWRAARRTRSTTG